MKVWTTSFARKTDALASAVIVALLALVIAPAIVATIASELAVHEASPPRPPAPASAFRGPAVARRPRRFQIRTSASPGPVGAREERLTRSEYGACMSGKHLLSLAKRTYGEWTDDHGWIFASAMASFAALSIAPILLIAARAASLLGERHAFLTALFGQLGALVGGGGAQSIDSMVQASSKSHQGTIATIVAVLVALFAGSKLFRALQQSIETIWEVEAPEDGIWQTVVRYVVTGSLTTIIILTLLAIVIGESFVSTVVTTLVGKSAFVGLLIRFGNVVLVAALLTPLIAALFRWLPRTDGIAWRDVWLGAAVTAVATTVGQVAIAWYISLKNESAMYGSAASVIVVLLWLYYSAYIFLFSAEFTQVVSSDRTQREGG